MGRSINEDMTIFSSDDAKRLQAVAIIMMLVHHLFKGKYVGGYVGIPLACQTLEYYIADSFKLCVAIYALISGIGAYYSSTKHKIDCNWIIKRTLPVYTRYVLTGTLIIMPLCILLLEEEFKIINILGELSLAYMPYSTMGWYLRFYVVACLLTPFMLRLINMHPYVFESSVIIITIVAIIQGRMLNISSNIILSKLIYYSWELEQYLPVWMTGMLIAKYDIFSKILNGCYIRGGVFKQSCIAAFSLITATIICVIRELDPIDGVYFDTVYAAVFSISLVMLLRQIAKVNVIERMLSFLSGNGIELWLLQSLFPHMFFDNVWIYWPKYPVLIFIWMSVVLIIVAHILEKTIFQNSICLRR